MMAFETPDNTHKLKPVGVHSDTARKQKHTERQGGDDALMLVNDLY